MNIMRRVPVLAQLAVLWAAHSLPTGAWAQSPAAPVVIGESVSIPSSVLKEPRSLLIAKPAGYESGTERYPVLYLLDGEEHFSYTSGMVSFLAGNDRIPKMLVVGISSEDFAHRTRDLTPPSTAELDNRFSPGNGGADAFLDFVAGELIPYVEKNYRTRPYRLLVGHSYGGLFAIHALISKPKLFHAYIAADPSLGWNNEAVVGQLAAFFSRTKELHADLYVTASNAMGKYPADVRRLTVALDEKTPAGFRWSVEWMNDETHGSIPLLSTYQGLEKIFDHWHLTDPLALFDKGGIEAVHRHFREGGRRLGFDRTTSPFTVSLIVSGLIKSGRLDEASKVLLHDPKAYPPPWNQLDALARAYAREGNVEQTIRHYALSLKENPRNEWARQKLTELGVNVESVPQDRRP